MTSEHWIDSHCHLLYDYDGKSTETLINEAQNENVTSLISICCEAREVAPLQSISTQHPSVFYTAGVHPHSVEKIVATDWDVLKNALQDPKCVAVGEIGLDYYYDHSDREQQREALTRLLDLAVEVQKPVVIHCREAEDDMLSALTLYAQKHPHKDRLGVIHCFTGTRKFAEACIDLGFYISFSGILTFKNAADLRETAQALPLKRLLVETDSPYLAPVPFRGKKCEPKMVVKTGEKLAELHGVSIELLRDVTTENVRYLFALPNPASKSSD